METILTTVKKLQPITEEDGSFDAEILVYINTVLGILSQLGLSEADKLSVVDKDDLWSDLFGERTDLEFVKTYIGLKTKLMFDPPTSSAAITAINNNVAELEWRIANLKTNKGVIINDGTATRSRRRT